MRRIAISRCSRSLVLVARSPSLPAPAQTYPSRPGDDGRAVPARRQHRPDGARAADRTDQGARPVGHHQQQGRRGRHHRHPRSRARRARRLHHGDDAEQSDHRAAALQQGAALRHGHVPLRLPDLLHAVCADRRARRRRSRPSRSSSRSPRRSPRTWSMAIPASPDSRIWSCSACSRRSAPTGSACRSRAPARCRTRCSAAPSWRSPRARRSPRRATCRSSPR